MFFWIGVTYKQDELTSSSIYKKCNFLVGVLFSTANLIEHIERCHRIYCQLLPGCAVAIALKAVCAYCSGGSWSSFSLRSLLLIFLLCE